MRKLISFTLVLLLVFQGSIPIFAQENSKITIAIMDFQNTSNKPDLDYLQRSIPEMLITNLAKRGRINIVERSRLQDALKEMELGMSGIVDQSRAVELGKAVGANAIMVGSYLDIGGIIRINARLIDVKTSKVLKAESVQGRTGKEIFTLMDQLAASIEAQLLGESQKPAGPKKPVAPIQRRQVVKAEKPKPTPGTTQRQPISSKKKGGSKTGLYILGAAALIGGGVAAAVLLGGKKSEETTSGNNSTVTITVNIP